MPTAAQNVQTAIDNVAAQLVEITANPKPTYSIDGQSVSWTEHYRALLQTFKDLVALQQMIGGPFEVRSIGTT